MASSDHLSNRLQRNNFDLLRLGLSLIVCLVHSADLSGHAELSWIPTVLSSKMAVEAFFIVSGFLIFMSYERSTSLTSFAEKRTRRLYPAYVVVILVCAFGLYAVSTEPARYFGGQWLKYLVSNLVFLNFIQPALPGVFDNNIFHAVNGALWSLKIEVMFYFCVPLIVMAFRWGRNFVLASCYVLSLVWVAGISHWSEQIGPMHAELARQLPGSLSFFVAGAAIYYHLAFFERHVKLLLAAAITVLILHRFAVPLDPLYPAALSIVVCFAALFCYAGNFGRYGDFSYGLYILHFPILQLLVSFGIFAINPWLGVGTGVALAIFSAVLMWHGVEKRWLARSSHYVQATVKSVAR